MEKYGDQFQVFCTKGRADDLSSYIIETLSLMYILLWVEIYVFDMNEFGPPNVHP